MVNTFIKRYNECISLLLSYERVGFAWILKINCKELEKI